MKHVVVIGAGACGLRTAIEAARCGAKVTLLDAQDKPGKKLLLTGNGKCNLTNLDEALPTRYRSSNPKWLSGICTEVFKEESVKDTLDFFREIGLLVTERQGYVYPMSNQSKSVLQVLLNELERLHVKCKYGCRVDAVTRDPKTGVFAIRIGEYVLSADACVLACGSVAVPSLGCEGKGYELAKLFGHTVQKVLPALTGLNSKAPWLAQCAGARTRGRITLKVEEQCYEDSGEIQWNSAGISGIVVFQLSRYASQALDQGKRVEVFVDLYEQMMEEELERMFLTAASGLVPDKPLEAALAGLIAPTMMKGVLASLPQKVRLKTVKDLNDITAPVLARQVKCLPVPITAVRGFEHAQVCMGGISLDEVEPKTLESRLCPGLFLGGEMLDVDGPCGGYNLQWAWSSGAVIGRSAADGSVTGRKPL